MLAVRRRKNSRAVRREETGTQEAAGGVLKYSAANECTEATAEEKIWGPDQIVARGGLKLVSPPFFFSILL